MTSGNISITIVDNIKGARTTLKNSQPEVFCTGAALKIFAKSTRKHLWWSLFSMEKIKKISKVTLVFSSEYFEIFNKFFFKETPLGD